MKVFICKIEKPLGFGNYIRESYLILAENIEEAKERCSKLAYYEDQPLELHEITKPVTDLRCI